MLRMRLLVGTVLIALVLGILFVDDQFAPWYPFLLLFQLGLSLAACHEFVELLDGVRKPHKSLCFAGVLVLSLGNWLVPHLSQVVTAWGLLNGILTGLLGTIFLYEMGRYAEPGRSIERMGATWLCVGYVGWLPCFFAQLRWLYPEEPGSSATALALGIFVPKGCDIGAYFAGRFFGRHKMTPVLSPNKTWEGAAGGVLMAVLVTAAIDRYGPRAVLHGNLGLEFGFGITVGLAGMAGDLAESLLKRDSRHKDASHLVPGFGGVLDVVDAVVFAAPVVYLWLVCIRLRGLGFDG